MSQDLEQVQLESDSQLLLEAAIAERLKMTIEQRIEAHENAQKLYQDLKTAGEALRAKPQSAS